MTEQEQLRAIIRNNLLAFQGGRKTVEQVTDCIFYSVYPRPKKRCNFGQQFCSCPHDYEKPTPCSKCRVAYESELIRL